VRAQPHRISFDGYLLRSRKQRIQHERWGARQQPPAQVLLGNPRSQRIFIVKFPYSARQIFDSRTEPFRVHHPKFRLPQCDKLSGSRDRFNLLTHHSRTRNQSAQAHAETRLPHQNSHHPGRIRRRDSRQPCRRISSLAIAQSSVIEHHPPSDRDDRRKHADDKTIARQQLSRLAQNDPRESFPARLQHRAFDQPDLRFDLRRPRMEMDGRAMLQRLGRRK
jgi:hypothetical protein